MREFMSAQEKRHETEKKRQEQMHNERMELFKGFLDIMKEKK